MTTTVRTDGIVFPDGTLQTSAATIVPPTDIWVYGSAYKATAALVQSSVQKNPTSGDQQYAITPYTLDQAGILDVGNRWGSWQYRLPTRAAGVTYTNSTHHPRWVCICTVYGSHYAECSILVNGVMTSTRSGDMCDNGQSLTAWAIVPPGHTYSCQSIVYRNTNGGLTPQPIAGWWEFGEYLA